MTTQAPARRTALTADEVLALPAMVDGWPTAAAACGAIARTTWYGLVRRGETPVPVVRIGRSLKVRRSDLLDFLGISEENGDGAGVAAPTPHAERTTESTGK